MKKSDFARLRSLLGKTQNQTAQLLGVSLKAVQSFEQGWRVIPTHVERQMLFLIAMKRKGNAERTNCWQVKKCPVEKKNSCPAWEFQSGHLCWFINGTICGAEVKMGWKQKIKICRKCDVLKAVL